MRLPDIDHQELCPVPVSAIKWLEPANLAAKWRSGIASENENHRFLVFETGELHPVFSIQGVQAEIRCLASLSWSAVGIGADRKSDCVKQQKS